MTWIIGAVSLAPMALWFWPGPQRIKLSDGTTLDILRVTVGPNHSCPVPLTSAHVRIALQARAWPRFTQDGLDNSVALWIDERRRPAVPDQLVLVDRFGWRWSPERGSLGVSPILFPAVESTQPLKLELLHESEVLRSVTLKGPAKAVSPVEWDADELPLEKQSGRLGFRLESFDVVPHVGPPSHCTGRAKMSMTWNGRPIRPQLLQLRLVDSLWRKDDHWNWGADGRFGTELSPHGVVWRAQVLVGRAWDEPLEPDEEMLVEPDWSRPEPVQAWEQEIAGIPCRISWTDTRGKVLLPSRFRKGTASWYALGAKVAVELPPAPTRNDGVTNLRIDFLAPDSSVVHQGIVSTVPGASWLQGTNSGVAPLPERYRIRIGVDVLQPVEFTVRPRIVDRL